MHTYIGVDNTQRGRLVMVCKRYEPSGEIRTLWREKLCGEGAVCDFFRHFKDTGHSICFVTTRVKHDPSGVLEECIAHGAQVRHYRPCELKSPPDSSLPGRYRRAEQLAVQAIYDTHYAPAIRGLRVEVESLDSKIVSLLVVAGRMRKQIYDLECQYPDPNGLEITF